MNSIVTLVQRTTSATPLALAPLNATSLRDQAYTLLKNAIAVQNILSTTTIVVSPNPASPLFGGGTGPTEAPADAVRTLAAAANA